MQHDITAQFKDGRKAAYTTAVWDLLISDKDVTCIYDNETGEILFYRQEERAHLQTITTHSEGSIDT